MDNSQQTASAATLGRVIEDLDHLNHSTEQDFLRIGGKLTEFAEAVNLISSELSALASLTSGEHTGRTSQALTDALDRSMEWRVRIEEDNRLLGSVRQEAGRLKRTLAGFEGTVSTFHALAVLTSIETARLGSAGADFGNLAVDVKLAAGSIQTRVETALDTGVRLIPPIERVLQNVSALQEGQAQDLPRLVSEASASLSSFRDIKKKTHDASVRLSARYEALTGQSLPALP